MSGETVLYVPPSFVEGEPTPLAPNPHAADSSSSSITQAQQRVRSAGAFVSGGSGPFDGFCGGQLGDDLPGSESSVAAVPPGHGASAVLETARPQAFHAGKEAEAVTEEPARRATKGQPLWDQLGTSSGGSSDFHTRANRAGKSVNDQ